jgi:hypothetical protein
MGATYRATTRRVPIWLPVVATIVLAGCSDSKELSTPSHAKAFIADVTRGNRAADWRLAPSASPEAKRAWKERAAIQDMGRRLRQTKAAWACELAEGSSTIGASGFTEGDSIAISQIAKRKGAKSTEVDPLIADVFKLSIPDLKTLTAAACS